MRSASVSVVCGVMNRTAHLQRALPTWLARDEVLEVLVVDWSSAAPLRADQLPLDARVKIVRVGGQSAWHLTRCCNLGLRLAAGGDVLRLDADVLLGEGFFERHVLEDDRFFYCADRRLARRPDDVHLSGVIYARRSLFLDAGGYNERLVRYGCDDDDLVVRMRKIARDLPLDYGCLEHVPHGDELRVANQPPEPEVPSSRPPHASLAWYLGPVARAIEANVRQLAEAPWSPDCDLPASFEVVVGEPVWRAREVAHPSRFQRQKLAEQERYAGIDVSLAGTTIVCGCRDRACHLAESLPTWVSDPRVAELVIVDWSSRPEEQDKISELAGWASLLRLPGPLLRVTLLRVVGEATWQPGPCYNLGLRHARCERVLKLDADVRLQRDESGRARFLDEHPLEGDGVFYAGDWLRARCDNERHLSGVVYARRHDLLAAGGWSERIVTYGYDDDDLYERLALLPVRRRSLNNDTLYHIPHSDTIRLQCQPKRVSSCWQETDMNRQMSNSRPWGPDDGLIEWDATELSRPDYARELVVWRRTAR